MPTRRPSPRRDAPDAPHRLAGTPAPLTTFVGRDREIAAIRDALQRTRLLTITGTGGSGKTRLALESVTREIRSAGLPGTWVELAAVRDPQLVVETVLAALGVRDEADPQPLERAARIFGDRPHVLVLDNAEHLVDACAALADALLRQAPALRIVVTSRAALGVAGETAWLVPPLSLPSATDVVGPEALATSEAVQLFLHRATAVVPGFAITPTNAPAVAQICRRLDGLPLALELAAARLRALSPEQIAARLDDRLRLLTVGNRSALPRHQTLRAAIDWSYDLLTSSERSLLARLAIFGGSFSLDAAEVIGAGGAISAGDVLDLLSSLVDRSLLDVVETSGVARYRLLETVREYAAARLAEVGETEVCAQRHAAFFAQLIASAEPALRTAQRPLWLPRLHAELENIRHALAWSRTADPTRHIVMVGQLHWFWFATGQWPEARQWLRGALELPEAAAPTTARAALLFSSGGLAALQAMCETSIPQLEEAVAIAESLGEARLLADARNYLAMSFNAIRDPRAEAVVLLARPWFKESGDLYGLRLNYLLHGNSRFVAGDLVGAMEATEEGVRVARVFGLDRELAIALQQLAMLLLRADDTARAIALLREALEAMQRDPQVLFTARALEYLGSSLVASLPDDGVRLHGVGASVRHAIGAAMWSVDEAMHAPFLAKARTVLGAARFDAAQAAGRLMPLEDAVGHALRITAELGSTSADDPSQDTSEYAVVIAERAAAEVPPRLRVRALGPLQIELSGASAPSKTLPSAKARELLVFLLVHPEGRTREQVGLALWPDASAAQLRNNFHVTLHHLRRGLGGSEWVRLERDRYRVDAIGAIDFDVSLFEDEVTSALREARAGAVDRPCLAAALSRYHGPFLDGDAAGDWAVEVAERLARTFAAGCTALATAYLDAGEPDAARQWFEQILRFDASDARAAQGVQLAMARQIAAAGRSSP